jgi:dihydrolipoamide dehydrogenase
MADQTFDYDVLVIGAGPGGYVAAIRAAQLGLKTACAESRETLGGTCLNVGCIPSKAMLHASEFFDAAASGEMSRVGVKVTPELDLDAMHAERLNVVVDSTGALELASVPKKMIVIGGGVIGLELGSVWRRLGAEVTVVEFLDQLLPGMDGEVRKEAGKLFKKQGMALKLSTKVTGVAVKGKTATVTVEPSAGGAAETLEADVVLVSIGRRPNVDGLALDKIGLTPNQRGQIETDHDFATKVPGVWAIGDVIPGPMLAHKAEDEGIAVAENIAGLTGIVNHDVIPGVVYTFPEIAGVGLTEEAAKEKGAIKVGKFPMMANSRAKTNHEPDGFVKIIADAATDRVLGVWAIASVAGTMIAEAALAMEFGAISEDIAYTCHAHPTHSEAIKEAAMAVRGKAIHV